MTYSLALDFIDMSGAGFPHPHVAHICIKTHTKDKRGIMFITPDCVSLSELEEHIERLHKELERIRSEANRKFTSFSK
ncbi:MAG: hypothetical protein JRJ57_12920 [Deltaproteobacteria bacterium]|nr:hypothetical protein [Deltaproteobacteria bacterium]